VKFDFFKVKDSFGKNVERENSFFYFGLKLSHDYIINFFLLQAFPTLDSESNKYRE
jgi:hypothetical protein